MFKKKTITTYLKAKNSLHATRISSFRYVFIVLFEKKTVNKIYIVVQVEEWCTSQDPEHKRLVPDKYIDKLGDLLDMISHL